MEAWNKNVNEAARRGGKEGNKTMSFIALPVIYESIRHLKNNVVLKAVDPLDNLVFEFVAMTPYPVYTYGLDGEYVDGYQLVDTDGNNHYLPATSVAGVDFVGGIQ